MRKQIMKTNKTLYLNSAFETKSYKKGSKSLNIAGYANTTSAINGIKFYMESGNVQSGTFKLYGIKGS